MDDNKSHMTDAEAQIERLKKMKMEKDLRDKEQGKSHFAAQVSSPERKPVQPGKTFSAKPKTKKQTVVKLSKENIEKLTRISKLLKKNFGASDISKDKLANIIMNRVLDSTIFIEMCHTKAELEEAMKKIKIDTL